MARKRDPKIIEAAERNADEFVLQVARENHIAQSTGRRLKGRSRTARTVRTILADVAQRCGIPDQTLKRHVANHGAKTTDRTVATLGKQLASSNRLSNTQRQVYALRKLHRLGNPPERLMQDAMAMLHRPGVPSVQHQEAALGILREVGLSPDELKQATQEKKT